MQARGAFGQEDFGSCLLDNPVQAISRDFQGITVLVTAVPINYDYIFPMNFLSTRLPFPEKKKRALSPLAHR